MIVPFKKINLGNALEEIRPLIESGMIGLGGKVFEFEQELAKYVGAKYVVAVDSCTSALFLCLKWEKAKKVGIPSMTVPLVADACIEAGKEIYFNDKVDWVGSAYLIENTNIWDSAHQLDNDQCVGMGKDTKCCFSFYPTKSIGSADGGAIATNDEEFANWARSISCYGRNQSAKYQNSWEYDIEMVGYKRHYTNLQSVICMEQLKRLPETDIKRRAIRDAYNRAFELDNVSVYLYRIDIQERDKFIEFMKMNGVECGVHFKPLHMMKAFQNIEFPIGREDVECKYSTTCSLPLFDLMTEEQVNHVINCVKQYGVEKLVR